MSKNIFRLAKWSVLGAIFHPGYTIVNAAVLGHEESNLALAGFGLGSLTLGILLTSVGLSFGTALSTLSAQAFG